jgi:hypothetical protein
VFERHETRGKKHEAMSEAVKEIRELLAGRPTGVNRIIKRFGRPVLDYCTAIIPDRSGRFERMVEDILVDILAQARSAARAGGDEAVFEFAFESAVATVRARYRPELEAPAQPERSGDTVTFDEALELTGMDRDELTRAISEGTVRAVRADNAMRIRADSLPVVPANPSLALYRLSAAERELLCLRHGLGFSATTIARWAGETPAHVESLLDTAATRLMAGGGKEPSADRRLLRYVNGTLNKEETAALEAELVKDAALQRGLDALRERDADIGELLQSPHHDLSGISVRVRTRNPHHALALPPTAALWLQLVGVVAMVLVFHSVGAYVAPPEVVAAPVVGELELPPDGRLRVGARVNVPPGSQALLTLDGSNRVLAAGGTEIEVRPPREDVRQVLRLHNGEVWGRFAAGGYPFALISRNSPGYEVSGATGAELSMIVGDAARAALPDNMMPELRRALAEHFELRDGVLTARAELTRFAGLELADGGLRAGDRLEDEGEDALGLAALMLAIEPGESRNFALRRGGETLTLEVRAREWQPHAVVRVFHGGAHVSGDGQGQSIGRGQWALLGDGPPVIGRRGQEDFRALRLSRHERFKQHIHWLNAESYPLRVENSLLPVERELRRLAQELERRRTDEVYRSGQAEVAAFERLMQEALDAATARVSAGEGVEAVSDGALSDEDLLAVSDILMGEVDLWRRQSLTGVYVALRDAAMTLNSPVRRAQDELRQIDSSLTRAAELLQRIEELERAMERQQALMAELRQSEHFDRDGSARAELDLQIEALNARVRAGTQASSRRDLIRVRLNELDAEIDREQRRLNTRRRLLEEQTVVLATVNEQITANVFSQAALDDARASAERATARLAELATLLEDARAALQQSEAAVQQANAARTEAESAHTASKNALETAVSNLTRAVAERAVAEGALRDARTAVMQLEAEFNALPDGDPRRQVLEAALTAARADVQQAEAALEAAGQAAEQARAEVRGAESAEAQAGQAVQTARQAAQAAVAAHSQNVSRVRDLNTEHADVEAVRTDAQRRIGVQETAKAELEALRSTQAEAQTELEARQLAVQETTARLETLETDAAPRRQAFARETETVHDGENARRERDELQRLRGRHQAVDDDIARRQRDYDGLKEERDTVAGSHLVRGYEQMLEDHKLLDRRVRALKYLRKRALLEDEVFANQQLEARDRFRRAAERTEQQAVKLLEPYCPPYAPELYARIGDDPELREAILRELWRMYYDASLDASDSDANVCYHVIVESGHGAAALERLNARWRTYLAAAVGRENFDSVALWTEEDLMPGRPDDDKEDEQVEGTD